MSACHGRFALTIDCMTGHTSGARLAIAWISSGVDALRLSIMLDSMMNASEAWKNCPMFRP